MVDLVKGEDDKSGVGQGRQSRLPKKPPLWLMRFARWFRIAFILAIASQALWRVGNWLITIPDQSF